MVIEFLTEDELARSVQSVAEDRSAQSCQTDSLSAEDEPALELGIPPDEQARYMDERETAVALALENWDDTWGDRETILSDLQRADDRRWRSDGRVSGNRAESITDDEMNGEETREELVRSERKLRQLAAEQAISERQQLSASEELP